MAGRQVLACAAFALLACTGSKTEGTGSTSEALARLQAIPVLGARAVARGALGPPTVRAVPPQTARGVLRVERDERHAIEIAAEHEVDAPATRASGTLVFADASRDLDAFVVVEPHRVEELRVLKTPRAATVASWRLRPAGELVSLRLHEGRILEALDAEGRAFLRTEPMLAVDARGVERAPALTLSRDGVAWRLTATLDVAGLTYPIALDPAWGPTGAMSTARIRHVGARLPSGKVLVAGGQDALSSAGPLSTAEIYDPATGTWTAAASMSVPRSWAGAAPLADGRVMALGGITTGGCVDLLSTEVFDPTAGTWSAGPNLPKKWYLGDAHALAGNKVAIVGGRDCTNGIATASVLDVAAGTWLTSTTSMPNERIYGRSSVFGGTKVLLTGGRLASFGNTYSTVDIYDASTNKLAPTAPMAGVRLHHAQVTLGDGRVMVMGGADVDSTSGGNFWTTAEIYSPTSGTWSAGPPTVATHYNGGAVVLSTGKVALMGGEKVGSKPDPLETELYDPGVNAWSNTGLLPLSRASQLMFALTGGSAIGVGGDTTNPSGSSTRILVGTADVLADGIVAGSKCSANGQCASGFCAGGVCCDSACAGKCQSCVEAGSVGACKSLAAPPAGKGVCDPYVCGAIDCKATCAVDGDCVATSYCNSATAKCEPRVDAAATCTANAQCKSGFCADGVCCDKACDGACQACNVSGSAGVCTALDGVADKHGKCASTDCTTTCVKGACGFKAAATPCGGGASSCAGNTLTASGKCSGSDERCVTGGTAACPGDLKCADATTCLAKCSKDDDCVGSKCDLASGACGGGADAGVDAGATADGGTRLDDKPKVEAEFTRCNVDAECATGHCVEGVCCDTECRGKCTSCALLASPGKCTLSPIGVDLRNDCGPALQCLGTCDGAGQCIGAGAGTMCSRNRCTAQNKGIGPAYCPAPGGKCDTATVVPFDCGPYVCEPAFGACRTGCVTSLDCSNGFVCDVGSRTCVAPQPAEDDSGCAVTDGAGRSSGGALVGFFAALALLGRAARGRRAAGRSG